MQMGDGRMISKPGSAAEVNPYASPTIPDPVDPQREAGIGAWRDGKSLVIHPAAALPMICLKSGAPATHVIPVQVPWCPPGFLVRMPTLELRLPLCDWRHLMYKKGGRLFYMIAGLATLPIPLLLLFVPVESRFFGYFIGTNLVVILSCVLLAADSRRMLVFEKFKGDYFWFSGAHPSFLAHLPPWPYGP
jgi:hypothetical protein